MVVTIDRFYCTTEVAHFALFTSTTTKWKYIPTMTDVNQSSGKIDCREFQMNIKSAVNRLLHQRRTTSRYSQCESDN